MNDYQNYSAGGPQQGSPQMQREAPLSAMAVTGLVLGILALLTSFLPIINNVSFILALLGVIFGIVGIIATLRKTRRGKALAIVALVLNIVAVVVVLATQSLFSAAIDDATSGSTGAANNATSEAPAAQPAQNEPAQEAKYAVTIDDCTVTQDYEGKPAIIITYTFTNNSEDATAFFAAVSAKSFQNGVQLDTAVVTDIDAQSTINEIKAGATTTAQQAYLLNDQSEVTVECSELISFNDELLATKAFSVA